MLLTGSLLVKRSEYDAARHARQVIEIQPDWSAPQLLFAEIYSRQGDREEAARSLQAAVSNHPSRLSIRRQLADLLVSLDRYDSAIAHYNILVDEQPEDAVLHVRMGHAHLGSGAAERAIGWAEAAEDLGAPPLDVLEAKFNH